MKKEGEKMTMKKTTRKFDGKTYHIVGTGKPRKKSNVKEDAKRIRGKGYNARCVKVSGGYRLYSEH